MKNIILVGLFLLVSSISGQCESALARITFYYAGEDSWGHRTSTGGTIKPWKTAAVSPAKIPYFSKITIPELGVTVVANDTGTNVIRALAAKEDGKNYEQRHALVVDIPVRSEQEYLEWEKHPALYTIISWE